MNNNKKPLQTREDKLAYLNGLKTGKRSLIEITEPYTIMLSYRDDQPDIVTEQNTGRTMTVEQAEILKAKARANNTLIWEEHKTYLDPVRHKPAEGTNKKFDEV